jgi:hypothetical protein
MKKGTSIIFNTLAVSLATVPNAFASATTRVYSSSILVLAFVGFLALIVVIQLIPAIMTLFASLKGLAKKEGKTGLADVRGGE